MELRDWKTLDVAGDFKISIPPSASWYIGKDECSFVISLPTEPRTEVLVARYDLPIGNFVGDAQAAIEAKIERFITRCIPKATGYLSGGRNVQTNHEGSRITCQAVVLLEMDNLWLVRGITSTSASECFLIHWNGPKDVVENLVLYVFESFETSRF
jgi:hypothetical protein